MRTRIEREFDPDAVRRLKGDARHDITVDGPGLAAHALRAGLVDELPPSTWKHSIESIEPGPGPWPHYAVSPALAFVHGEPGHAAVGIRNHPAASRERRRDESLAPLEGVFGA